MSARLALALLLALAGCAGHAPSCPDPVGPTTVTRAETVDVPVAAPRETPPELRAPLRLDQPQFEATGPYCLSWSSYQVYLRMLSGMGHYYDLCRGFAAGDAADAAPEE
ncbi:MAG: hypothetical protein AB7Q81_24335 [Gammaproteobacteria bacterium]